VGIKNTALDAIPDIVLTDYPGQAAQLVEDQITYLLSISSLKVILVCIGLVQVCSNT